ncbi:peptidyl-tRNA hydrolase [Suhomyces tanzawaensis NRRL Y-17324]|uniref:Peptidyl-tRNA hydrolase n=1 Tax=Suhomyces tanzawaensis NRRL Y-17324 TaxID=984487 RepID=A0A1E4SCQ5_9ASCO|nr:peptidyl-tRNA hydrolase [Suhomyces tanzawaensis NRRL Y-17324]ODV77300.1 peptidyl-tRNA hydrolase [Suhomyces tanzawaensis NRRL Y-17324]
MDTVVIFSIGNPGPVNRHSAGHLMLLKLMEHYDASPLVKGGKGKYSSSQVGEGSVIFAKSNCYMNESGQALKDFTASERLSLESIIVVLYDDFENKLGKVKLSPFKAKESHNGLKSIYQFLGPSRYENCFKLGVGIGPKPSNASRDSMASWVLSAFKMDEKQVLVTDGVELLVMYLQEFLERDGHIPDFNKFNAHMTKVFAAR